MLKKLYFFPPIFLQVFIWLAARFTFAIFWRLEIRGAEKTESLSRGVIFASNHSGEFDAILMRAGLSFVSHHSPMFYTSREPAFYNLGRFGWRHYIYGGVFFNAMGAYPVYVGLHNYEKSLKNHIEILDDRGSLCIFPEGRSSRGDGLLPGKGGVAYLAYKTGMPVVPVGISGLYNMNARDFFFGRRKVVISYGEPLFVRDLFADPYKAMIEEGEKDDFKEAAKVVMREIDELMEPALVKGPAKPKKSVAKKRE